MKLGTTQKLKIKTLEAWNISDGHPYDAHASGQIWF